MKGAIAYALILTVGQFLLMDMSGGVEGENGLILFVGRFHPMVLHLPIGALLALFFMEVLQMLKPKLGLSKACECLLWFCAISIVPTVMAGHFLGLAGGYNEEMLSRHRSLGWATALLLTWLVVVRSLVNQQTSLLWIYRCLLFINVGLISLAGHHGGSLTHGSDYLTRYMPSELKVVMGLMDQEEDESLKENTKEELFFAESIRPVMSQYCIQCHGPEKQKGNIRLDELNWDIMNGPDAEGWHTVLDQINAGEMPPEGKSQPTDEERRRLVNWITEGLEAATLAKKKEPQQVMRRLTRVQYSNALNDLLGLNVDFATRLPDDGKSKMGFSNDAETLQTSPLHLETFQAIARDALGRAIAPPKKPEVIHYSLDIGKGRGKGKPGGSFGGYQSVRISADDFEVGVLDSRATTLEQKELDEIKKKIGIGMRGSSRERFTVLEEGINLYSALPHREKAPKSWQGPSPNLKVLIRSGFPVDTPFALRVKASKGPFDTHPKVGFIDLRDSKPAELNADAITIKAEDIKNPKNMKWDEVSGFLRPIASNEDSKGTTTLTISEKGLYQVDLVHPYLEEAQLPSVRFSIGRDKIEERLHLEASLSKEENVTTPITMALINQGTYKLELGGKFFVGFRELIFTPIPKNSETYRKLMSEADNNVKKFGGQNPVLRVFAGTRTDDGMDYANFSQPQVVDGESSKVYEFLDNFSNLPVPPAEKFTSGDLSNTLILGLWNANLVNNKADSGPPMLIESIELEAPYYPVWPPESHSAIFFDSKEKNQEELYTRQILKRFCEKAFRRPIEEKELEPYLNFWKDARSEFERYEDSVKEVLVGILCSPKFFYMVQTESKGDRVNEESSLASRLSFFLWNRSPDETLRNLAGKGKLKEELNNQVDRMIDDPRSLEMVRAFTREWLRIDRLEDLNANIGKFPSFNRFIKEDMAEETFRYVHQVLLDDGGIEDLIASNFAMLNKNLARFYGIDGVEATGLVKVDLPEGSKRGGLLTQGAFLSGHSDGTHSHPIKRAVWLKEKILGEKAPPPPPNVPELDPDTPGFEKLTLKEQLELHRNKASCVDCHLKIDPYGIVFENFDATGRYVTKHGDKTVDAKVTLPDGTVVEGVEGIRNYILEERMDDFARSLIEHLYSYALGRPIGFADEGDISNILDKVREEDYAFRSVVWHIVNSSSFLQLTGGS